jgi:hypothetical protein
LLRDREQQIEADALHPRHGGDGLPLLLPLQHEHGIDQVMRRERMLAHEIARERVAPQAPRAPLRIGGVDSHVENCA